VNPETEGGFSRRAVGWIVGVAAGSFLLALLLSAFGEDLGRRPTPHTNTFSYSVLGHRAAVEYLQASGLDVVSRRIRGGFLPGPERPLVLAEPDISWLRREVADTRVIELFREAQKQAAVVVEVLPKWRGEPCRDRPEWLCTADLLDVERIRGEIGSHIPDFFQNTTRLKRQDSGGAVECSAAWGESFRIEAEPLQLFDPIPHHEPWVECPGGWLVAHRAGDQQFPEMVLVSEPDLINNQGLGRADHAALLYQLLAVRLKARGAVFDETIHGFLREPGLLSEAFRFPLVLAVLQAFVLTGTVLWAGLGRFGKPLPAPGGLALGKTVLLDNTAQLLTQGGDLADSLARYYRQTARAVAAHYSLSPELSDAERLEQLRRIATGRGVKTDPARLLERVRQFSDKERRAPERAVQIAQRIHRWRQEMMDGHPDRS